MKTNKKGYKILDMSFDGANLHLDLRHSFAVEKMSGKLVKDIMDAKNKNPNLYRDGGFVDYESPVWIDFRVIIDEDENGEETFSFTKTAKELL